MTSRLSLLTVLAALVLAPGCSDSGDGAAVTGTVTVDGKPADRANVFLHPQTPPEGRRGAWVAQTGPDGSFTLSPADGLPPGDYAVTATWPTHQINGGEDVEGPDRLGGKYRDPGANAGVVTVKDGDNALPPIALKSK